METFYNSGMRSFREVIVFFIYSVLMLAFYTTFIVIDFTNPGFDKLIYLKYTTVIIAFAYVLARGLQMTTKSISRISSSHTAWWDDGEDREVDCF